MRTIKGYTIDQIKEGFAAMERAAAESIAKTYTVDELIVALRNAAAKAPQGGDEGSHWRLGREYVGEWSCRVA